MIKKFQIELFILSLLILGIIISYDVDIFINNYIKSLQSIYLKEFFTQITVLGDSKWYFVISLLSIISCYLIIKFNFFYKHINSIKLYLNFSIFLFISLIITGLFTQLLKHLIGRARPNHSALDGNFSFFNLNSEFHSFPSGHTSTIFAVILVVVLFIPKLKYFFIFLAGIVALSRIFVGAHFFTDILGGIVISYIGIKLTKLFLEKYYPIKIFYEIKTVYNNNFYFSLIVFLSLVVFLSVGSSIDIYFSSLFYNKKLNFLLQEYYFITILFRKVILPLIVVYILVLPIFSFFLPTKKLYYNYEFKFKDVLFLWGASALSILIIINLFLKNIWGRARPGDIIQLGGSGDFTPWYQISDACNSNCSFVSGDAAVGFSLIIFYFIIKKEAYFWLSVFFGFCLGLIRIMEGGHFVSDIIMAAIIVYISNYFLVRFCFHKND